MKKPLLFAISLMPLLSHGSSYGQCQVSADVYHVHASSDTKKIVVTIGNLKLISDSQFPPINKSQQEMMIAEFPAAYINYVKGSTIKLECLCMEGGYLTSLARCRPIK